MCFSTVKAMTGKAFSHWYQRYQTILRFFVYIRFFVWAHDRQSRYKQKPPERQYRTAGRIEQTPPTRRRVIAGVTIRPYFTAWQKYHKTPLKNFDFNKFTVFFTVFWNLLKI
jgi:hypothetical protein